MEVKKTILSSNKLENEILKNEQELSKTISADNEEDQDEEDDEEDDDVIDLDDLNDDTNEDKLINETKNNQSNINHNDETRIGNNIIISAYNNSAINEEEELNLLNLDLNLIPKEAAIEYLLHNKEMNYKKSKKKLLFKDKKYENVKSHFETKKKSINYNVPLEINLKDPETTCDFNTACTKYLAKLLLGPKKSYNKLLKLMMYNTKIDEIKKVNLLNNYES